MPSWKRCSNGNRGRTFRSGNHDFKQRAQPLSNWVHYFITTEADKPPLSEDSTFGMLIRYGAGTLNLGSSSAAF
jgi:hypothetical protein